MPKYSVNYSVDAEMLRYTVEGDLAVAEHKCLLEEDDDLTRKCSWHRAGYTTVSAWDETITHQLRTAVQAVMDEAMRKVCKRPLDVALTRYHTAVNDKEHLGIVEHLRQLPVNASTYFPIATLDESVSNVLGIPVTCYNANLACFSCFIRIVRPNRQDNNPLHKDVWLDRLRHAINLYIPIAGSNHLSALSLIPESHHWKESEIARTHDRCIINGTTFMVPSVTESTYGLRMIRPHLNENEILVFSPYLVHGGACNLNENISRLSLEMRFWRRA